jgi:hypothetical protein
MNAADQNDTDDADRTDSSDLVGQSQGKNAHKNIPEGRLEIKPALQL